MWVTLLSFQKTVEIIFCKVWKFWAAPNKKKQIMKNNNSKVSKTTYLENHFVWTFSDKKYRILEMQISVNFSSETCFEIFQKYFSVQGNVL